MSEERVESKGDSELGYGNLMAIPQLLVARNVVDSMENHKMNIRC
jgi:hypothetical protein